MSKEPEIRNLENVHVPAGNGGVHFTGILAQLPEVWTSELAQERYQQLLKDAQEASRAAASPYLAQAADLKAAFSRPMFQCEINRPRADKD